MGLVELKCERGFGSSIKPGFVRPLVAVSWCCFAAEVRRQQRLKKAKDKRGVIPVKQVEIFLPRLRIFRYKSH